MNRALKISLLANLGLVAAVLWLAQRPRINTETEIAPLNATSATEESSTPVIQPASPTASLQRQPKFQWSQLESPDYHTYVANLRAIGCPAPTISDIITADVDSVYAARRGQLMRQQTAGLAAGGFAAQQAYQAGLQQLQKEQASLLKSLLEPAAGATASTDAAAGAAAADPSASAPPPAAPIRLLGRYRVDQMVALPIVFQDPGPELMPNPAQLAVIRDLRESFNQELSGLNLDPAGPEYRQRWLKAQHEADAMMSALLGGAFTMNYQMKAADQPPPAK